MAVLGGPFLLKEALTELFSWEILGLKAPVLFNMRSVRDAMVIAQSKHTKLVLTAALLGLSVFQSRHCCINVVPDAPSLGADMEYQGSQVYPAFVNEDND